jgi:haloacetate dehalogenase
MADLTTPTSSVTPIKKLGAAPFLDGFELSDVELENGITLRVATGGSGPPLLLLHGHPQTHVTWRKVAPALARSFTIVAPDLRGYGDSSKPAGGDNHIAYSKREMAKDQVLLMRKLGHTRFAVAGHDRGGRVAHRMALDHPDAISRIAVIDIAPTATMYALTNKEFATRYFWWFFLIQPAPLPERLIAADPEFFLRKHIEGQNKIAGATEPDVFAEYLRCYSDPATRHAICEDYRAAASIDLQHDAADADMRITAPLLALWGARGTVGALYDVLKTWRDKATSVSGRALDCGHTLQEELPGETVNEFMQFFASARLPDSTA